MSLLLHRAEGANVDDSGSRAHVEGIMKLTRMMGQQMKWEKLCTEYKRCWCRLTSVGYMDQVIDKIAGE